MSLQPYKITALRRDDAGGENIMPNASVSITSGGVYASLYTDAGALTPISNPFTCDANGEKEVWIESGIYSIAVSGGQSWDVIIGSAVDQKDTYGDVRALTANYPFETIIVGGANTLGDGGGGVFAKIASGTDNGITILTDMSGQAWGRIFDSAINTLWSDLAGADMAPAINACFAAASALGIQYVDNTRDISIQSSVIAASNVTFRNSGRITIDADIPAASVTGAIIVSGVSKFKFIGGEISVTYPTFDNTILDVRNSDRCLFRNIDFIDSDTDRYPLGCIRSQNNTRTRYEFIDLDEVGGIGLQTVGDTDCHYLHITGDGDTNSTTKSMIETNNGAYNTYAGLKSDTQSNTATSGISFNDNHSVLYGCTSKGGLHCITVGHVGYEASYSAVSGNVANGAADALYNVQASKYAAISGNVGNAAVSGLKETSGAKKNAISGNCLSAVTGNGYNLGDYSVASGNIIDGFGTSGFRASSDGNHVVASGNIAINGTGTAFNWGLVATQINAVLVGNMAGDDQAVKTLTTGFKSLSAKNLFYGNATDGNATFRQFDGTYSATYEKNLATATVELEPISKGVTGGAGSAGSGNQYIGLTIGATSYKILHDGTI